MCSACVEEEVKSGWRDARCANEKIPFDKRMKMGQSLIRREYERIIELIITRAGKMKLSLRSD